MNKAPYQVRLRSLIEGSRVLDLNRGKAAIQEVLIREALKRTGGNVSCAARLLGVQRTQLYRQADKLGVPVHLYRK